MAGGGDKIASWMEQLYEDAGEDEDEVQDRVSDFFAPFNDAIWELDTHGEFGSALVRYIRAHARDFARSL